MNAWGYEGFGQIGLRLIDFTFYYPLFMSYLWMIGAVHFYLRFEHRFAHIVGPPALSHYPGVSIIVPMRNEADNARETIGQLIRQRYPLFEIIAINDASTDATGAILDELLVEHQQLRVLHLAQNQGKAIGLNMATLMSRYEYLVCIDGDALLDEHAVGWLIQHFIQGPRVGAITGNPRVRNRSTLLGKIQVGEFSSIIGLIKRAQRTYGRIFTVSGVVCAFRKSALHDIDYWSADMLTEDIDVSWKLQTNHWDVRYEPRALCWILMPESLNGLFKQRLRWAMGGLQVLVKYFRSLLAWRERRMWGIYIEYTMSVLWALSMGMVFMLWALGKIVELPEQLVVPTLFPGWNGVLVGTTCLLQIGVALWLDAPYDRGLGRVYYWMIWYPLLYWMVIMLTTLWAIGTVLLRKRRARALWTSPDRGLKPSS
jgi:biofilm PGA synthesis N-glycosyltransferase PgaC